MMGIADVVTICGVLPALWIWLLCAPKREMQTAKVSPETRDWRDELDWRK